MRTNIVMDDVLVAEAFKYSTAKTKRELVHIVLTDFVERKRQLNLSDLEGKIKFKEGYNYKKLREEQ